MIYSIPLAFVLVMLFEMAMVIYTETHCDEIRYYRDSQGEHRWRLIARNNQIIGAATEGYKNRTDCEENARSVCTYMN